MLTFDEINYKKGFRIHFHEYVLNVRIVSSIFLKTFDASPFLSTVDTTHIFFDVFTRFSKFHVLHEDVEWKAKDVPVFNAIILLY